MSLHIGSGHIFCPGYFSLYRGSAPFCRRFPHWLLPSDFLIWFFKFSMLPAATNFRMLWLFIISTKWTIKCLFLTLLLLLNTYLDFWYFLWGVFTQFAYQFWWTTLTHLCKCVFDVKGIVLNVILLWLGLFRHIYFYVREKWYICLCLCICISYWLLFLLLLCLLLLLLLIIWTYIFMGFWSLFRLWLNRNLLLRLH